MRQAYRKTIMIVPILLAALIISEEVIAGCEPEIQSFISSKASYDPLKHRSTTAEVFYSIRNKGSYPCNNLKLYFCTDLARQKNGEMNLLYTVRNSYNRNILNRGHLTGCPSRISRLDRSALSHINIPARSSLSSGSQFEVNIPRFQFLDAGDYRGDILQLAVYDHHGKKITSRNSKPETQVASSCYLPSIPVPTSATNTKYSLTRGLSGGAVNFNGAINTNSATLKKSSIELLFRGARCNYRANLSIKSVNAGMVNNHSLRKVSSFLNKIDYTAIASFCGVSTGINTAGTGLPQSSQRCSVSGLTPPDLRLNIKTSKGDVPLLAGNYEDTLIIKIGSSL